MRWRLKEHEYTILLVILALLFFACAPRPSIYLPNSPTTPLLARKGEIKISVATNSAFNHSGETDNFASIEAAYALTEKIGLIANASYSPTNDDSNNVGLIYGEMGAGYFTKFQRYGRFEVYAGLGLGNTQARHYDREYFNGFYFMSFAPSYYRSTEYTERSAHYFIPFIQASVGAEGDVAAFAFTVRVSALNMSRLHIDSLLQTNDTLHHLSTLFDTSYTLQRTDVFLEPGFTFRIGHQHIKFDSRLWWSVPIVKDPPFLWGATNVSIGLTFDF